MNHSADQTKCLDKLNYSPKDSSELQTIASQHRRNNYTCLSSLSLSPSLSPLLETIAAYHDRKRRGRFVGGPGHAQVQAVLADGRVVEPHLLACIGTARVAIEILFRQKIRGIDSERFSLFRVKKCLFRGIPCVSEKLIPRFGTERNVRNSAKKICLTEQPT
jgi:hypothetical protein